MSSSPGTDHSALEHVDTGIKYHQCPAIILRENHHSDFGALQVAVNLSHCRLYWVVIFFLHVQWFLLGSLYNLVNIKLLLQPGFFHFILFYYPGYGLNVVVTVYFTYNQHLFWSLVGFLRLVCKSASLSGAKLEQAGALTADCIPCFPKQVAFFHFSSDLILRPINGETVMNLSYHFFWNPWWVLS